MALYELSAMAIYFDTVEADTEEEAIDKFCRDCPYDIDGDSIICEKSEEDIDEE